MKNFLTAIFAAGCMFGMASSLTAKDKITISGTVEFTTKDSKVQIFRRAGFDLLILGEATVNPDHTYKMDVDVPSPGAAFLTCDNKQTLRVWLEDENLNVNFQGADTAEIKSKQPYFIYIDGGKNNDLMNLLNFNVYCGNKTRYEQSQALRNINFATDTDRKEFNKIFFENNSKTLETYLRFYAEHYADRNSVLAVLSHLNQKDNADVIAKALAKVEKLSPESKVLVDEYRQAEADKIAYIEAMNVGKPAPQFTCLTVDGKRLSPGDFKGKVLVIDFWASWCGPCRAETPKLKKYYEEFKGENVEFLSVSIDEDRADWLKALKEDQAEWPQGRMASKEAMDKYQFNGIPFIIVIDQNGNIYRKRVRGEAIRNAVRDALDGK